MHWKMRYNLAMYVCLDVTIIAMYLFRVNMEWSWYRDPLGGVSRSTLQLCMAYWYHFVCHHKSLYFLCIISFFVHWSKVWLLACGKEFIKQPYKYFLPQYPFNGSMFWTGEDHVSHWDCVERIISLLVGIMNITAWIYMVESMCDPIVL